MILAFIDPLEKFPAQEAETLKRFNFRGRKVQVICRGNYRQIACRVGLLIRAESRIFPPLLFFFHPFSGMKRGRRIAGSEISQNYWVVNKGIPAFAYRGRTVVNPRAFFHIFPPSWTK